MRILIAINLGFSPPFGHGRAGGSETHSLELANQFSLMGHEVDLIDSRRKIAIPDRYDVVFSSHTSILSKLVHLSCPIVHTCHGVLPSLEQPVPGAHHYVSVSEEVQAHLSTLGYKSEIIRQPIDCAKFRCIEPARENPERILFFSRYQRGTEKIVEKAFGDRDLSIWAGHVPHDEIPALLNRHDVVIGLGRSALEAMACERNVVVFDYNGGDGFVTPDSVAEIRRNNFSGRRYSLDYSADDLRREVDENYTVENAQQLRKRYVLQAHHARSIAEDYLKIIS